MKKEDQEKMAMFRFGVISPLIGLRRTRKGERENILKELTESEWQIPGSGRSYISRSTILSWVKAYEESGKRIESLHPKSREDKGQARSMNKDIQQMLLNLRKEKPEVTVTMLMKIAKQRKLIPLDFSASISSIYRFLNRYKDDLSIPKINTRKFEAELPNDLWQSDCMHGPRVINGMKVRKAYLLAFIDDHSRIIPHAEFYLNENLENYIECLQKALSKRGLPRKLYVDNGPSFKSHRLKYSTASLGIALIHATAYRPQGKGKIERFFRTVRQRFIPVLPSRLTLKQLNEELISWINTEYHQSKHSSINQKPLERYLAHVHLLRTAPKDMSSYFRIKCTRRVLLDRTVSLNGNVFEAPCGLISKTITLLYHKDNMQDIEVQYQDKSYGYLTLLDKHLNYRIRNREESKPTKEQTKPKNGKQPESGQLFKGE